MKGNFILNRNSSLQTLTVTEQKKRCDMENSA